MVILDFLDFDGDELYFKLIPELIGKTYQEALLSFDKSSVIGIVGDQNQIQLIPDSKTIINKTDQLIFISEDDDTIFYDGFDESIIKNLDKIKFEENQRTLSFQSSFHLLPY